MFTVMNYIYAVRFGPYVKIGTTTDPVARLRQLRGRHRGTLSPDDLSVDEVEPLFVVQGDYRTEHLIHCLFTEDRVLGEWYQWTPRIETWVRSLDDSYRSGFTTSTRVVIEQTEDGDLEEVVIEQPVVF